MTDGTSSQDSATPGEGVEIEPEQLTPEALRGLAEEFVTREGTDYGTGQAAGPKSGPGEWTLDEKVEQVLAQIERGEARIVFDPETETVGIVRSVDLRRS